jgi:hypothetical protein
MVFGKMDNDAKIAEEIMMDQHHSHGVTIMSINGVSSKITWRVL